MSEENATNDEPRMNAHLSDGSAEFKADTVTYTREVYGYALEGQADAGARKLIFRSEKRIGPQPLELVLNPKEGQASLELHRLRQGGGGGDIYHAESGSMDFYVDAKGGLGGTFEAVARTSPSNPVPEITIKGNFYVRSTPPI
jgi:hypothetical protein